MKTLAVRLVSGQYDQYAEATPISTTEFHPLPIPPWSSTISMGNASFDASTSICGILFTAVAVARTWHRADAQQHGQRLQRPRGGGRLCGQHAVRGAVRVGAIGQAELQDLNSRSCRTAGGVGLGGFGWIGWSGYLVDEEGFFRVVV